MKFWNLTKKKMLVFYLLWMIPLRIYAYTCDTTESQREKIYQLAMNTLEKDFEIYKTPMIFPKRSVGNPAGTYGVFEFDPTQSPVALDYLTKNFSDSFNSTLTSTVMAPRDAIVTLMCSPPSSDYFSFVNYVLIRFNLPNYWLSATPLNDPINHLVLNISSSDVHNSTFLVLSSGDGTTLDKIQKAFGGAGWSPHATNVLPLPQETVRFTYPRIPWILESGDLFSWQFRVSSFNRTDPRMKNYLETTWPSFLLRARVKNIGRESKPLEEIPRRNRSGSVSELYLKNDLDALMEDTIQKFSKTHDILYTMEIAHIIPDFTRCLTDPGYFPIFPPVPAWNFSGLGGFCDFFVRDCLYSVYPNIDSNPDVVADLLFPMNRSFIVIGVNQVLTGNCVYSNILMTGNLHPEDPAHTSNLTASDLTGSVEINPLLYRYVWSRDCKPFGQFCREFTVDEIQTSEYVFFAERKYLNPTTKIGPDPMTTLPSRIIVMEDNFVNLSIM